MNPRECTTLALQDVLVSPTFIIAGGAKCGTTSLYHYLRQHPEVYMPAGAKEPHYFVDKVGKGSRGCTSLEEYRELFSTGAGKKAVGEASTGYLGAPESPGWIREVLGPIKIIILLRNPARRAYSMWGELVREGMEAVASFDEALALEGTRAEDPTFAHRCLQFPQDYYYFGNGLYSPMVARYFEIFGRQRVFVGLFEDLAKDPQKFCRHIFEFLEVDPDFRPAIEVHNQGRIPRWIGLQHGIEKYLLGREDKRLSTRLIWALLRLLPRRARGRLLMRIRSWNVKLGYEPHLPAERYASLMSLYGDDIERLESLLHRSLSVWSR